MLFPIFITKNTSSVVKIVTRITSPGLTSLRPPTFWDLVQCWSKHIHFLTCALDITHKLIYDRLSMDFQDLVYLRDKREQYPSWYQVRTESYGLCL